MELPDQVGVTQLCIHSFNTHTQYNKKCYYSGVRPSAPRNNNRKQRQHNTKAQITHKNTTSQPPGHNKSIPQPLHNNDTSPQHHHPSQLPGTKQLLCRRHLQLLHPSNGLLSSPRLLQRPGGHECSGRSTQAHQVTAHQECPQGVLPVTCSSGHMFFRSHVLPVTWFSCHMYLMSHAASNTCFLMIRMSHTTCAS